MARTAGSPMVSSHMARLIPEDPAEFELESVVPERPDIAAVQLSSKVNNQASAPGGFAPASGNHDYTYIINTLMNAGCSSAGIFGHEGQLLDWADDKMTALVQLVSNHDRPAKSPSLSRYRELQNAGLLPSKGAKGWTGPNFRHLMRMLGPEYPSQTPIKLTSPFERVYWLGESDTTVNYENGKTAFSKMGPAKGLVHLARFQILNQGYEGGKGGPDSPGLMIIGDSVVETSSLRLNPSLLNVESACVKAVKVLAWKINEEEWGEQEG